MLARLPGPLRAPPMPAARRGARCPVPAAAAARAAAGSGPRAARAHIRGRRRSLARSLAPRLPRRAARRLALATLRARRRRPPSSPLPPRASHGPRCAPAAGRPAPGSPRTARALGVAAAWNSGAAAPAWLRGPAGAQGLSALQPRAARLTPSTPQCVRPHPPSSPRKEAGGACGSRRRCVRINRASPGISWGRGRTARAPAAGLRSPPAASPLHT